MSCWAKPIRQTLDPAELIARDSDRPDRRFRVLAASLPSSEQLLLIRPLAVRWSCNTKATRCFRHVWDSAALRLTPLALDVSATIAGKPVTPALVQDRRRHAPRRSSSRSPTTKAARSYKRSLLKGLVKRAFDNVEHRRKGEAVSGDAFLLWIAPINSRHRDGNQRPHDSRRNRSAHAAGRVHPRAGTADRHTCRL